MQRREAKISPRDRKCRQRPKEWNDTYGNPHRNGCFKSAWKSAVWWDWMVVCAVRYEPVSADISPVIRMKKRKSA
jgi:hypothetical protein